MLNRETSQAMPEEKVITKAVLRAATILEVSNTVLAKVVGVSNASVSRMKKGEFCLQPNKKEFELAVLFIRMFRSLDALFGGDDKITSSWLKHENNGLGGKRPVDVIQRIEGLLNVINYLDSRRAIT